MAVDGQFGLVVSAIPDKPEPGAHGAWACVPRVAVVGSGPAGLMAAETLAEAGVAVTVYERLAAPGRKFLMAGRGGLNITHSEPLPALLARYHPAEPRLRRAIEAFPPDRLVAWMEGLGQPSFVGSSGRVFPVGLKASPLLRSWLRRLQALGVELRVRQRWTGWTGDGSPVVENGAGRRVRVVADALVLALGGASWPRLGSDGLWVDVLTGVGARVAPLRPANCGAAIDWSEAFRARFAGEPLKRIAVSHGELRVRGEVVIVAGGLEGGPVYALSRRLREDIDARGASHVTIDLKPDETLPGLAQRLARPRGKQSQSTFLRKALSLPPAAVVLLNEASAGKMPRDPEALARLIKELKLPVSGLAGLERAISTAGGVSAEAIDDNLMLHCRPGTFVAGEMLDWEAPTGGYLLQGAFATGVAAAEGALLWLRANGRGADTG